MLDNPQNKLNQQANQKGPTTGELNTTQKKNQSDSKNQSDKPAPFSTTPERKSVSVDKVDTQPPTSTLTDAEGNTITSPPAEEKESGFAATLKKKLMADMSSRFGQANAAPDSKQEEPNKQHADQQQVKKQPEAKPPNANIAKPNKPKPSIPKANWPSMPKLPKANLPKFKR